MCAANLDFYNNLPYVSNCTCVYIVGVYMCVCIYLCMCVCMYVRMYVCTYTYVYTYVCVYVRMYVPYSGFLSRIKTLAKLNSCDT